MDSFSELRMGHCLVNISVSKRLVLAIRNHDAEKSMSPSLCHVVSNAGMVLFVAAFFAHRSQGCVEFHGFD